MDPDVIARARVHREVALDRVPVVVLADQLVELLVAGGLHEGAPALGKAPAVAAALPLERRVGCGQALRLLGDPAIDLSDALHPARHGASLEIVLERAPRVAHALGEGPAQPLLVDETAADDPLDGRVGLLAHPVHSRTGRDARPDPSAPTFVRRGCTASHGAR